MTLQLERVLQQEIMLRLKALPVIAIPVPNGTYMPAHTPAERALVARIISQMKKLGMMVPGAPDLVIAGRDGRSLLVELKREKSRDLLGRSAREGQLNDNQKDFKELCGRLEVPYVVCRSWDDVVTALSVKGVC